MSLHAGPVPVPAQVVAVCRSGSHDFSKVAVSVIRLEPGLGVEGDSHAGTTVQHLSLVRRDPTAPNLRQVHLMPAELHDELRAAGHPVQAGSLGENITTRGVDLLALPRGTRLAIGATSVLEVTGLRNPCHQIDTFSPGLLRLVLGRDEDGLVVRRAGIMAVVLAGGEVSADDPILVQLPPPPHQRLECV